MKLFARPALSAALLLATMPAFAAGQYNGYSDRHNGYSDRHNGYSDRHNGYSDRRDFHQGLRDGARGGSYYDERHANDGYDQRYDQQQRYYQQHRSYNGYSDNSYQHQNRGGIGPGKGALIGGAGGALLGGLLGGGLKGSLIGGAAGAGIGAIAGEANQNHRRDERTNRNGYYNR